MAVRVAAAEGLDAWLRDASTFYGGWIIDTDGGNL